MPNQELVKQIKKDLEGGADRQDVIDKLLNTGYQQDQILEAMNIVSPPEGANPPPPPKTENNKLKGPFELLGEAWNIYKDRWKTLIGINLLPGLIFLIFVFFVLLAILIGMLLKITLPSESYIFFIILGAIALLALIIGGFWSQVALLYAIKDRNEKIGVKEAYRHSKNKIVSFVWINFLTGIIVSLGFLVFIVPGFIFMFWFGFAGFVLVNEDLKGFSALSRSKQYFKGLFVEIFFRLLAIGLVLGIIQLILQAIPIVNIVAIFILPLIMPFLGTVSAYLLYENLKQINSQPISNPLSKITKIVLIGFLILTFICAVSFITYFVYMFATGAQANGQKYVQDYVNKNLPDINPKNATKTYPPPKY